MRFNMTSFVHYTLNAGTVLYSRPLELTHTVHVVYMCVVHVCVHMWVGYVCQDECGHQKLSSGVCLDCTEAGSLTGTHRSLIQLVQPASLHQGFPLSASQGAGFLVGCHRYQVFTWDPNSGSQVHAANVLPSSNPARFMV